MAESDSDTWYFAALYAAQEAGPEVYRKQAREAAHPCIINAPTAAQVAEAFEGYRETLEAASAEARAQAARAVQAFAQSLTREQIEYIARLAEETEPS